MEQQNQDSNTTNTIIVAIFVIAVIVLGYLHYSGYFKKESTSSNEEKTEIIKSDQTKDNGRTR
jgi:hypothetical protein